MKGEEAVVAYATSCKRSKFRETKIWLTAFVAVWARSEDECAFAKYRDLNPFAATILAMSTILR